MTSHTLKTWALTLAAVLAAAMAARAEPLTPHPAAAAAPAAGWNDKMGRFGESLVREFHRASGEDVFDLNVGEHGIDALVRTRGRDGQPEYKIIEVKTLQDGTDFHLGETRDGRQLSPRWIEGRLAKAAKEHRRPEARAAAAEALEQFRKSPSSVRAELHGISVGDNRYLVKAVDPGSGAFTGEVVSRRVTGTLEELGKRARSEDVRRAASQYLAEYERLRAAVKPQVVPGSRFARQLGETAGVEEKQMSRALKEASEHIHVPGQSRWVRVGGKAFKFVGRAAGAAGVVIAVAEYTAEAAEIEQKVERGELTREQADAEQAKLTVGTTASASGGAAGAAAGAFIGSFVCPGAATVVGGIVGGVGGYFGAELVMAATGLTDALGDYLAPGAENVREACSYLKAKGLAVTVAAREQLREWLGAEAYDEAVAALDSGVSWSADKARQAGTAVKETAVYVKDRTVEGAAQIGDGVSAGAGWTWDKAKSGWGCLRRQFE